MRRINLKREEGVAMTEFALVVPIFLLLVVGLLVFGRMFFYWIEANHLANETARWAVVDQNPYKTCAGAPTGVAGCQSLQQHARSSATDEFENNVRVCIDFPGESITTVSTGDPVRVKVQVPVTFVKFFGFGVTIRGASTMRVENIRSGNDPTAYTDAQNLGPCV